MSEVLANQEVQIVRIEIARLSLEDGDILVVRTPHWTTEQVRKAEIVIEAAMKRAGIRAPLLICPTDVEFTVLKAPDAPKG